MVLPAASSEVAYGTSTTFPGKVGDEYFMTKQQQWAAGREAEVACERGSRLDNLDRPPPARNGDPVLALEQPI
jgi:glucose-6-phosphate isomerase